MTRMSGAFAATIVAGAAIISGCTGESRGSERSPADGSAGVQSSCRLDVRENTAMAYRYGVPDGWLAAESGGGLVVTPDDSGTAAAIIYTALLSDEHDTAWFLERYMGSISTLFESYGGTLETGGIESSGDRSIVSFEGRIGEVPVTGEGTASVDNRFATAYVTWSPDDGTGADRETLRSVVECFDRITVVDDDQLSVATDAADGRSGTEWGSLVQRTEGSFGFWAPANWSAEAAEAKELSLLSLTAPGNDAAVLFLFMTNRNQQFDDGVIDLLFRPFGISAKVTKSEYTVPNARVYDFTGDVTGRPARGMVAVRIDAYTTTYVCYASMVIAEADKWAAAASTLIRIAGSAGKTDISGNLASLPPIPNYGMGDTMTGLTDSAAYRDSVRETASGEWSEAMLGYVTVESPSTGQQWRTSVNSYNPAVGGYVRQLPGGGGTELLEQK